jgi:hypothetical protein
MPFAFPSESAFTFAGILRSRGVLVHESEFTASTVLTVSVVFRELAKSTVEPH